MDQFMDDFLLGLVDLLVAVCRYFHRPRIKGAHNQGIFDCRIVCPYCAGVSMVFNFRGFSDGSSAKGTFNVAKLSTDTMLFGMFDHYPLAMITSIIALVLIAVFFITSADSATFVLGMQTTYGSLNPANSVKVSWGIIQSAMAAALLYSGGLSALQNTAILAALPFSVVVIFMLVSLYKSLSQERKEIKQAEKFQKPRSPRVKKA